MTIDIVLISFLLISLFTDLKYRKILNMVVFPVGACGLLLNLLATGIDGIILSVTGLVVGFLFLLLFYLLGGVGAGDVKFMAAVGSLKGPGFVLVGGIYGAVFGGIVALLLLTRRGMLGRQLKDIVVLLLCAASSGSRDSLRFDRQNSMLLPYAALLSVGMLIRYAELMYK